ncbi:MAG TPA: hypothetical protein EYP10_14540, partial [Armatimonadetes bacterium]|nr:hypothetical protein [Armatimonadota bacterium]
VATDNKLHQFLDLSERTEMLMSFDSIETVERLGKLACERRMEANVLLIIDIGFHRLGVPVGEAVSTAIAMARVRGIRLRGVQIYAGHIYSSASLDEATRIAHDEIAQAAEVADRIRKAGIEIDIISIGSTPSSLIIAERRWTGATELRAGNYVFMDRQQVRLGIANYDDCALRVFATVISKPSRDRILIDAGSKTLTSDPARPPFTGFGHVVNKRGIELSMLSEEVTTCHLATDADSVSVGELLEIVPNHACMMTNLAERIYVGRNGLIEDAWTAQARGKVW